MASNVRRPSNLTAAAVRFRLAPLLPFSGSSGSVNSDTTRCSELIRVPSLVEGCDYKHWLVLMKPPNGYPPRNDIVQGFIRTLAMALGSIFPFLNSATSVTTLFLRCNYMDGPLPAKELKDLTILEVLDLSENRFSGSIPVTRLSSAGYKSLRRLRNLEIMDLSENAFTNSIFPFLCAATSLKSLFLGNNRMVGSFPVDELKYLTNLELLDLRINRFNGSTPVQEVSALRKLNALDLSDNEFSSSTELQGKTKHILSNSTEIEYMKLANNGFQGNLPSSMGNMKSISYLDISHNSFNGELPRSFVMGCYSIYSLTLSHNKLSGEVFQESANFTVIWDLSMENNMFTGKIGERLPDMKSLKRLDISNNNLMGVIPRWIGELPDLRELHVSNNSLESSIPRQLCGLRMIQLMDLAKNRLNGSIPSCLSHTSFVLGEKDSFIGFSQFFGFYLKGALYFNSAIVQDKLITENWSNDQIKIEFSMKHRYDAYLGGNLKLLFGIDLSENELSGEIPAELGGLVELQGLNLSHNNLSGVIPESFSGLKNAESLDISFNRLQGRIPQELTELNSLAVFNVSFNNLSGAIPQGNQFNTFDTQSFLGNSLLCGQQINRSCDNSNFQVPDNEWKEEESQIDIVSFYWSSAAGYVTVLLGIFSSLSFDSPWSRFWFYVVDAFIYKAKNLFCVSQQVAEKVVNLFSFATFKNLEVNRGDKERLDCPAVYAYFRKGKVGDWANYLTPRMAARIHQLVEDKFKDTGLLQHDQ
ncbi:unnamed protein product [Brassica oleracea]|nr:unnamed protein product [Brassica napus]